MSTTTGGGDYVYGTAYALDSSSPNMGGAPINIKVITGIE